MINRRHWPSALGLLAFVVMLTGTSKAPPPSPSLAPPLGFGGGGEGGEGGGDDDAGPADGDAGAVTGSTDAGSARPRDAGRPGDAGASAPETDGGAGATAGLAPWSELALPIGAGVVDAIRIGYPGGDAARVEATYLRALRAKGFTQRRADGDATTPGGRAIELTRAAERLVLRVARKDGDVTVSLTRL